MKHKLTIGLIIGMALAALGIGGFVALNGNGTAEAQNTLHNAAQQNAAPQQTALFAIENMTCPACPFTVKKAMKGVQGVKSVAVNFGTKTATVVFDPTVATAGEIGKASTNAGYPASSKG